VIIQENLKADFAHSEPEVMPHKLAWKRPNQGTKTTKKNGKRGNNCVFVSYLLVFQPSAVHNSSALIPG
jgi:hypothetical protein